MSAVIVEEIFFFFVVLFLVHRLVDQGVDSAFGFEVRVEGRLFDRVRTGVDSPVSVESLIGGSRYIRTGKRSSSRQVVRSAGRIVKLSLTAFGHHAVQVSEDDLVVLVHTVLDQMSFEELVDVVGPSRHWDMERVMEISQCTALQSVDLLDRHTSHIGPRALSATIHTDNSMDVP